MRDFKEQQEWHKAHRFAMDVYQHSRGFPLEERFGLTSQRNSFIQKLIAES